MSRPAVRLRVHATAARAGPSEITLHAGDLIGRISSAALCLNHPNISEVHALVSLRGNHLALLGLRGPLRVRGTTQATISLQEGQRIALCEAIELEVLSIDLPEQALALLVGGEAPAVLSASVYALLPGPPPRLCVGFDASAVAQVWSDAARAWISAPGGPPEEVVPGAAWIFSGVSVEATVMPLRVASTSPTWQTGRVRRPLTLVLRFDSAAILQDGHELLALSGLPARILCELHAFGAPTLWSVVAGEVWKDDQADEILRNRWDRNLAILRRRLREADVRANLVRADGTGRFELHLEAGDVVQDEM